MRSTSRPGRELLHLVEDEPLAADDAPLADVEDLDRGFEFVLGDPDHVEVLAAFGDHLLLLDRLADGEQPVTEAGGPFELQSGRRGLHVGFETVDDLVGVAVEELAQVGDELAVRHLLDLADARAGALLDVEQQARPPETLVLIELRLAARSHGERPQQEVEGVADCVRMGVGPEVTRALAFAATHHERSGPLLVDGDGEERVALVVAKAHVETRVVLLDERVLEHQRFDLVAHDRPLHGLGRLDHLGGPRVQIDRRLEVVRQPLAQVRRLADVDHAAVGVLELVRARRFRNGAGGRTLHHL